MTEESYERRSFRDSMDLLLAGYDADSTEAMIRMLADKARKEGLTNTRKALDMVRDAVENDAPGRKYRRDPAGRKGWWVHGLTMARLLADLEPMLPCHETDVMLAAALSHVLREILVLTDPEKELNESFPLDPEVWKAVMIVTGDSGRSEEEKNRYYALVRSHRPALLVKLAGRGDVVSRLSRLPLESSLRYARETRKYFLPMCIRAREQYPELYGTIGTLMEKMRCLAEVADILDLRFAGMEKELEMEILELQQDNARMRGMLNQLRQEIAENRRKNDGNDHISL